MSHGGNIMQFAKQIGCCPSEVLDFSANIHPEQAVDWRNLKVDLVPYADPNYTALKTAFKQRYALPEQTDCEVFNGASAAIFALLKHFSPSQLVLYTPIYSEYARVAKHLNCPVQQIDRLSDFMQCPVPRGSTVIFVNPATPDGTLYNLPPLLAQWQAADCTMVIDESFLDFCEAESVSVYLSKIPKLYLIKSLSKFYGCAGIRVGFVAAASALIKTLQHQEPAWKLSSVDMAYMQAALQNHDFIARTRVLTDQRRRKLEHILKASGLFAEIYPGAANFLLAHLAGLDGYALQAQLVQHKILIRVCDNFAGLDRHYVRFAVKDDSALAQLEQALSQCLA